MSKTEISAVLNFLAGAIRKAEQTKDSEALALLTVEFDDLAERFQCAFEGPEIQP